MKQPSLFRPAAALAFSALLLCGSTARAKGPAPASEPAPAAEPVPAVAPPTGAAAPADAAAPAAAAVPAAPAAPEPAAEPAPPPPPPRSPADIDYDRAHQQLVKKKYDDALSILDTAAGEEGATPVLLNRIRIMRAQLLLSKKKPETDKARALILRVIHNDPELSLFTDAAESVRTIANEFREVHPFVMNDTVAVARSGRPLKLRAHVLDPRNVVAGLKAHFRAHDGTEYSDVKLTRDKNGYAVTLRDPDSLASGGVTDDYTIDYYFTATDLAGKVVDTGGSEAEPLGTAMSNAKAAAAEVSAGIDLNAVNKAQEHGPIIIPPPPKITPWYLQWYSITGAAVIVVAAIVVPVAYVSTRPQPAPPANLGVMKFAVIP